MLVFLISSMLVATAADVPLYLSDFEVSISETEDPGDWRAIAIGTAASGEAWRQARTSFELTEEPAGGQWLLRLGGAALQIEVRLNDVELTPTPDPFGATASIASGAVYRIASDLLRVGPNTLRLVFRGAGGAGFERGPAYLLPPRLARVLRPLLDKEPGIPAAANHVIFGTAHSSGPMLQRISSRSGTPDGEHELVGHFDLAAESPSGQEISWHEMSRVSCALTVPSPVSVLRDSRLPKVQTRVSIFPALSPDDAAIGATPVLFGEFNHPYDPSITDHHGSLRMRLFPASGGALRSLDVGGITVVHNGRVGIFAPNAEVLGAPSHPEGLRQLQRQDGQERMGLEQSQHPTVTAFGVIVLPMGSSDEDVRAFIRPLAAVRDDVSSWVRSVGNTLTRGPKDSLLEEPGILSRRAFGNWLSRTRPVGSTAAFVPRQGLHSQSAFFGGELALLHFTAYERSLIEWLLSTRGEDGGVGADLVDPTPWSILEADSYAVLRAMRLFEWVRDGDAIRPIIEPLLDVLRHARELLDGPAGDWSAVAADPGSTSPAAVVLACIAAHQSMARLCQTLGMKEQSASLAAQGAALTARLEAEGWREEGFFALGQEDDPHDQVVGLLLGSYPEPRREAYQRWLLSEGLPAGPAITAREALCVRGLLALGQGEAGRSAFRRYSQWLSGGEAGPLSEAAALYYGTLVFGLLGIERSGPETLVLFPRSHEFAPLVTPIALPEGAAVVNYSKPDVQRWRRVSVRNGSAAPLFVRLGVPGALGTGHRVTVGSSQWSVYESVVEPASLWQQRVR
jgi:hypothetical protein